MTYGEAVNADEMRARRYLPEGLVEGCRVKHNIPKDQVLTYDDVELPTGRLADKLRTEQYRHFHGGEHQYREGAAHDAGELQRHQVAEAALDPR